MIATSRLESESVIADGFLQTEGVGIADGYMNLLTGRGGEGVPKATPSVEYSEKYKICFTP